MNKSAPYQGNRAYIFINYCHSDMSRIEPYLRDLSEEGYRLWFDDGIHPGSEWPETIAEKLDGAVIFLAFISSDSLLSHNCRREINYAVKQRKNMTAVFLDQVKLTPGMEMQLGTVQEILSWQYGKDELMQKIREIQGIEQCRDAEPEMAADKAPVPAPEDKPFPAKKPGKMKRNEGKGKRILVISAVIAAVALTVFFIYGRRSSAVRQASEPVTIAGIKTPGPVTIAGQTIDASSETASFSDAEITRDDIRELGNFPSLKKIRLESCSLDDGVLHALTVYPYYITDLEIIGCYGDTDFSGQDLSNLTHLETLRIEDCGLEGNTNLFRSAGKNMKELVLSDTGYPEECDPLELDFLNRLPNLEKLEIDGIVPLSLNPVSSLGNLTEFRLVKSGMHLGADEMRLISGMKKLRVLSLYGNTMTPDGQKALTGMMESQQWLTDLNLGHLYVMEDDSADAAAFPDILTSGQSDALKKMTKLERLNLSGMITDANPDDFNAPDSPAKTALFDAIGSMKNLKSLDLSNCFMRLGEKEMKVIDDLSHPEELALCGTMADDQRWKLISFFMKQDLKSLNLEICTKGSKPAELTDEEILYLGTQTKLESLKLTDMKFSDEAAAGKSLAALHELKHLELEECGLSSGNIAAGCGGLTELNLSGNNGITSADFASNLTSLREADFSGCALTSIKGLENCTALRKLVMNDGMGVMEDQMDGISSLGSLKNLRDLRMNWTEIGDNGSFLAGLSSLRTLHIADCDLGENGLKLPESLSGLDISGNTEFTGAQLKSLKWIRELDVSGCSIKDISPLGKNTPYLRILKAGGNAGLSDISPLSACQMLRELSCDNCDIRTLSGLESLKKIRKASFVNNGLYDWSALKASGDTMKELSLSYDSIGTASGGTGADFSSFIKLEQLSLADAGLTGQDTLTVPGSVRYLGLADNGLKAVDLSNLKHLEGIDLSHAFSDTAFSGGDDVRTFLSGISPDAKYVIMRNIGFHDFSGLTLNHCESLILNGNEISKIGNVSGNSFSADSSDQAYVADITGKFKDIYKDKVEAASDGSYTPDPAAFRYRAAVMSVYGTSATVMALYHDF